MIKIEVFNDGVGIFEEVRISENVLSFFSFSEKEMKEDPKNVEIPASFIEYLKGVEDFNKILESLFDLSRASRFISFEIFIVFYLKFLGYQDPDFRKILSSGKSSDEMYSEFLEHHKFYIMEDCPHFLAPDTLLSFLCHTRYFYFGDTKIELPPLSLPYILNITTAALEDFEKDLTSEEDIQWEPEQKSFFDKFKFLWKKNN